ncbi:pyridoxal phosphate-dependent aminotransferase [Priestia koreensis]|uniref:pyridoxal phosphate-dependent aminotransferase n=1 Tax=Priestia koreensis TaxID=284581 RepID=UPI0034579DA9
MYYINPHIKSLYRTSSTDSRYGFIRLDMNENPEGLPKHFFESVLEEITPEYVAMYPETGSLIKKLGYHLKFESDNICLTNGSDDAIRLLFEAFGEPGKKVISVNPSFEMYRVYMGMYGMVHSPIEFNENFEVEASTILSTINSDTGIVVLLNPNSPIGASWSEDEIKRIIEKANANNAMVIIDEAYYYFSSVTFLNLVNEYKNVVVLRTFSKMLSVAGCRLGYIVANNKLIDIIKRACSSYPVNCFAIKFAEKLLDNNEVINELIEVEKKGREYLLDQLQKSKYFYHFNEGNYVLIKPNKCPQSLFKGLKQKNILIKTYQMPILSKWIRVTTGSRELMEKFWVIFKELDRA